jgi:hypothetical protein
MHVVILGVHFCNCNCACRHPDRERIFRMRINIKLL